MRKLLAGLSVVVLLSAFTCGEEVEIIDCFPANCRVATVKNLAGLDGCGWVFVLSDGKILEPEIRIYVQEPKREDDPIYYFEFKEGKEVCIQYENTDLSSICMVGETVFITKIYEKPEENGGH